MHLIKQGNIYHFRRNIPSDLVSYFNKNRLVRSIKTSNKKTAITQVALLNTSINQLFFEIRQKRTMGGSDECLSNYAREKLLKRLPATKNFARDRLIGSNYQKISELVEMYLKERKDAWVKQTYFLQAYALNLFVGIVGDKRINELEREDCRNFFNILKRLPSRLARFKNQSIQRILDLKLPPAHPKTINIKMTFISAFLNFCVREQFLNFNVARGLVIKTNEPSFLDRDTWSNKELQMLIGGIQQYKESETYKYWIPLVGMFSGMRLNEICCLRVEDVVERKSIWCFEVSHDAHRLKTKGSERVVPIHQQLIDLGFLDYLKSVHNSKWLFSEVKTSKTTGSRKDIFSKYFARFKKNCGVVNPKVVFHSLRHTFVNHLKQKSVEDYKIAELVGHKINSITMSRYGKVYDTIVLNETIQKVKYDVLFD